MKTICINDSDKCTHVSGSPGEQTSGQSTFWQPMVGSQVTRGNAEKIRTRIEGGARLPPAWARPLQGQTRRRSGSRMVEVFERYWPKTVAKRENKDIIKYELTFPRGDSLIEVDRLWQAMQLVRDEYAVRTEIMEMRAQSFHTQVGKVPAKSRAQHRHGSNTAQDSVKSKADLSN